MSKLNLINLRPRENEFNETRLTGLILDYTKEFCPRTIHKPAVASNYKVLTILICHLEIFEVNTRVQYWRKFSSIKDSLYRICGHSLLNKNSSSYGVCQLFST